MEVDVYTHLIMTGSGNPAPSLVGSRFKGHAPYQGKDRPYLMYVSTLLQINEFRTAWSTLLTYGLVLNNSRLNWKYITVVGTLVLA